MSDIEKLRDLCNSESELIQMEDELERIGWIRQSCGYWIDPDTSVRYSSFAAYHILKTKNDFTPRLHYDDVLDPSKILKPKKDL